MIIVKEIITAKTEIDGRADEMKVIKPVSGGVGVGSMGSGVSGSPAIDVAVRTRLKLAF